MKYIGRINTYIASIEEPYVEKESVRTKYENNLKALRVWHYFHLTMRWGAVPYVEESATLGDAVREPMPKEEILDTLFVQAKEIASDLASEEYTTDKFMFNKYSLKALTMRYALYHEQYELAAELAKEIMDSGNYSLHPNYGDLFQYEAASNNNEFIIWQNRESFSGERTYSYNHLGPPYRTSNGDSYLVPLKSLVDSYWTLNGYKIENCPQHTKEEHELNPSLHRDPRYEASIFGNGDPFYEDTIDVYNPNSPLFYENKRASSSGYWFKKFVSEEDIFNDGNFEYGLLRYAEVLLTYAEAKIMLNDINAIAKKSINEVRERAGLDMSEANVTLPRYSDYNQQQWIDLIRNERRIELAAEGERYNDIIRWEIAEDVLNKPALGDTRKVNGELKSLHIEDRSFNSHNYSWPFHESVLKVNPNLEQNLGY